eukprot:14134-Rhodomonas_salina.1
MSDFSMRQNAQLARLTWLEATDVEVCSPPRNVPHLRLEMYLLRLEVYLLRLEMYYPLRLEMYPLVPCGAARVFRKQRPEANPTVSKCA